MHEATLHEQNCYLTLTYNDQNLPPRGNLDYKAFQDFMRRYRKHTGPNRVRFYMCGEYGEKTFRPHYHACIFGHDFDDKQYYATNKNGDKLFTSPTLEKLWPYGFSTIGAVTFESAAYVARYVVQKITGHNAKFHYARKDDAGEYSLRPEFNKMSLKPGIGRGWLDKWQNDVYPHDYAVVRGMQVKPPKYYDKQYAKLDPETWEEIQYQREANGRKQYQDNTEERLKAKEQVAKAKARLLIRNQLD